MTVQSKYCSTLQHFPAICMIMLTQIYGNKLNAETDKTGFHLLINIMLSSQNIKSKKIEMEV
jgi:hypothetical protein